MQSSQVDPDVPSRPRSGTASNQKQQERKHLRLDAPADHGKHPESGGDSNKEQPEALPSQRKQTAIVGSSLLQTLNIRSNRSNVTPRKVWSRQVLRSASMMHLMQPIALYRSLSVDQDFNISRLLALAFFAVVAIGLVAALCFTEELADSEVLEDQVTPKSLQIVEGKDTEKDKDKDPEKVNLKVSFGPDMRTLQEKRAKLFHLQSIKACGTWAKTYRKADRSSKDALELLFCCSIIPTDEFANSFVSQEHIDECIWISTQMLREKTLEQWVESWPQAMRTFEESVTACFAARKHVISDLYGNISVDSPRGSDMAMVDCRTPIFQSPEAAESLPRMRSDPHDIRMMSDPYLDGRSPVAGLPRMNSEPGSSQQHSALSTVRTMADMTSEQGFITVKTLADDQASIPASPALSTYVRGTSSKASPHAQLRISQHEEFENVMARDSGRSAVLSRCRQIMRDMPNSGMAPDNKLASSGYFRPLSDDGSSGKDAITFTETLPQFKLGPSAFLQALQDNGSSGKGVTRIRFLADDGSPGKVATSASTATLPAFSERDADVTPRTAGRQFGKVFNRSPVFGESAAGPFAPSSSLDPYKWAVDRVNRVPDEAPAKGGTGNASKVQVMLAPQSWEPIAPENQHLASADQKAALESLASSLGTSHVLTEKNKRTVARK